MAKRYKKGNHKHKKKVVADDFYAREQKLNRLIAKFKKDYYNLTYPPTKSEYECMNQQRLEIKRLFSLQDDELWKQSRRRKRFYYKQLNKFKYYYVAWKYLTYYIYLEQRFGMPVHLSNTLSFYKKTSHDIVSTIYRL